MRVTPSTADIEILTAIKQQMRERETLWRTPRRTKRRD